jgi:adenylate kinase
MASGKAQCRRICLETGLGYLSASELIKWKEISKDPIAKAVADVQATQGRLIQELYSVVKIGNKYLLDGHFTLFNVEQKVTRIPKEIFDELNPFSLNLIIDSVAKIKARLEERDNRFYHADLLDGLQNDDIVYANELSELLGVKLNIGRPEDLSQILNSLK